MSRANKKRPRRGEDTEQLEQSHSTPSTASASLRSSITIEALQQLHINQSHGVDLEQCMQHTTIPSFIPSTPLQQLPASPLVQTASASLPSLNPKSMNAPIVTALPLPNDEIPSVTSLITRPLSHSIGIRSLTFNRMACDLAVTTSDTLFLWKSPNVINRCEQKLQNDLKQIIASSPVVRGRNKKQSTTSVTEEKLDDVNWHCEAILPFQSLPIPTVGATSSFSTSSSSLVLKSCNCPWLECPNHDESRLKQDRDQSNSRSSSINSTVVQFSPDESKLFVAVNRIIPLPKNSPLFTPTAASSPLITTATASKSGADCSPANSHSQQLEADIDAMLAGLNASPPPSTLNVTQQSEIQSSPAISTQDKSKRTAKGKAKKNSIQTKQDENIIVPSYSVYSLDVRPTFSLPASATNSSQSTSAVEMQSSSKTIMPSPAPAVVDATTTDMDPMLAELLGEMSEEMKSPPSKGKFSAANKCSHVQICFAVSHAVTSLLSFGRQEVLLVGDATGVVSMWEYSTSGKWNAKRSFLHPRSSSTAKAECFATAVKSLFPISDSTFVTVYENADIVMWDTTNQSHPLQYLAATIQSSPTASDVDAKMAHVESKEAAEAPFVASPTYSPERSQSLGRTASSTHTQSQIIVPETQSQMLVHSLSTTSAKDSNPIPVADSATTVPNAAVIVHSVQRVVTEANNEFSALRLLLLMSPSMNSSALSAAADGGAAELNLKFATQSSSAVPSSTPAASGRRSSRKSHVDSIPMPSPLCKSSLPNLVMLELYPASDASIGHALDVNIERFTLPLLLTDDNPSTHVTAIASSCTRVEDWQEKCTFAKGAKSLQPPVVLAGGLSSGGLVLYSANSNSLLAFMSEDAPPTASQLNDEGAMTAEGEDPPLQLSCEALLPQKNRSPLFASQFDQENVVPVPTLPVFTSEKPAASSPRVKTSQQNKKRKTAAGAVADVQSHHSTTGCPSCSVASNSKHICRRAVTSLAFHPTLNLFAVGDQLGHVHIYCGQAKA